uniref:Uncharacterized protein n=1 Tax=Mustela putorius furo TaxID=9669 RepID=M3XYZ6_MUSPF
MCFGKAETLVSYPFGTRQQRKLFPHYHPQNLLGNKFLPLRGAPHRGPGCYIAEDVYGLAYNLSKIPTSKKGYTFGARTAERFKVINKVRNGLNVLRFSCDPCCYMYLHWEAKRGEWEVTKKCALKFQKNI